MTDDRQGRATQGIHAGTPPDPTTGARSQPIYQTTSYEFPSAGEAAARYALEGDGDIYARMSNPTVAALEERLTTLHDAAGSVATASGMAALDAATFLLASPGDNIVTASTIYGGTATYFRHAAQRRDIEARFVDTRAYEKYAAAIDDDTAVVHCETIGNPALITPDLERLAEIAHEHGAPLLVDNTFASPILCRPLEHGADLVWSSTTKWIHGAGTTVGGILLDGGSFEWSAEKYPELAGQNRAYHDVDFSRDFPAAPFAAAARYRSLRTLGGCQGPFDAWVTLQGLETLHVRMERHCENAAIVAEFLADHPAVSWVAYPGLADHESHAEASQYLDGGYGGMVSFGLDAGYDGARQFCEETELCSFLANVGDSKTLVIHPASTTHGQLTPDEQREAGVKRDLVRLSVGIEDPADIVSDIDGAISRATS